MIYKRIEMIADGALIEHLPDEAHGDGAGYEVRHGEHSHAYARLFLGERPGYRVRHRDRHERLPEAAQHKQNGDDIRRCADPCRQQREA